MDIIASTLIVGGYLGCLIFGILLLIAGFTESVGWGLAMLFVPFASLIFVILHWDSAKIPFLGSLGSIGLIFCGMMIGSA